MCGICGIYLFSDYNIDVNILKNMASKISHRGPDEEGYLLDKNFGFAIKRLSIIDLKKGKQPIYNEDKSLAIVFNGEIYNFLELRNYLSQKGHIFITDSDTEVLLHLYEDKGTKMFEYCEGMFAFALWDKNNRTLLLARDKLGIKPLYFYFVNEFLLFSSEIKSLLTFPNLETGINFSSLLQFLRFQYIPSPETIFKNIYSILPGHFKIISINKNEDVQYWELPYIENNQFDEENENKLQEEILDLLKSSVKKMLRSDVPIGALLSGGIDSSILVYLMTYLSEKKVKTFSLGFKKEDLNELPFARLIANKFNTEHFEICSSNPSPETLTKVIYLLDQPLSDPAAIPTYEICKLASQKVKVVLSGEGGDEIFLGYNKYKICYLSQKHHNLYKILKFMGADKIIPLFIKGVRGKKLINVLESPTLEVLLHWTDIFREDEKIKVINEKYKSYEKLFPRKEFYPHSENDVIANLVYYDIKSWLVDDILMKIDRMSMANSIEARVPFLDDKLIDKVLRLPLKIRFKNGKQKYLLKYIFKDVIPKSILIRKKHGFDVPLKEWLFNELRELVFDYLSPEKILRENLFNYDFIKHMLNCFYSNKYDYSKQIWSLLNFEIWYDIFINSKISIS